MELKGKKVLVTGADGFIGSHLVEALLDKCCDVRAFVYYNSFNNWGWLDTLPTKKLKDLDVVSGDIRDPNGVTFAMKGCDVVFHLAALIGIPFSYHSPDSYVDTNIKGTLNVLQAARHHGTSRILVTSTSEVYGTAQYTPIDEKHPFQGQSPYSATKIGADRLAESFYRSFGLPVVIARPFNTFGPRQSARAVIPTIITQLLSGVGEVRLGRMSPTRDFNYVKDVRGAGVDDGSHSGYGGEGRGDHLISRSNVQRSQCKSQSVGAIGNTNRVSYTKVGGKLLFKRFDFGGEDVAAAVQHALNRAVDFLPERLVLRDQIASPNHDSDFRTYAAVISRAGFSAV